MAASAIDHVNLTRICEFARNHLHQSGGDDGYGCVPVSADSQTLDA
jgi:hypothetical protein